MKGSFGKAVSCSVILSLRSVRWSFYRLIGWLVGWLVDWSLKSLFSTKYSYIRDDRVFTGKVSRGSDILSLKFHRGYFSAAVYIYNIG